MVQNFTERLLFTEESQQVALLQSSNFWFCSFKSTPGLTLKEDFFKQDFFFNNFVEPGPLHL